MFRNLSKKSKNNYYCYIEPVLLQSDLVPDTLFMRNSLPSNKQILITGGSSGLGLALVRLFLKDGYSVVATGRQQICLPEYGQRFEFHRVDFSNLSQTAESLRKICETHNFSLIINNAGILSPPVYTATADGFEYTFQINFLSQLIVDEIVLLNADQGSSVKIAAITSMVYRLSSLGSIKLGEVNNYRPLKAYSDSKHLLILMSRHLSAKYKHLYLKCFTFDPGVFSSGIYRMQNKLFRQLYMIAAPYMRKPEKVAAVLADLLINHDIIDGSVYNIRKKIKRFAKTDPSVVDLFWKNVYSTIDIYLK